MNCPICSECTNIRYHEMIEENYTCYACANCADDRHNVWSWFYTDGKMITSFKISGAGFGIIEFNNGNLHAKCSHYHYQTRQSMLVYDFNFKMEFAFDKENENIMIDHLNKIFRKIDRLLNFQ